MITVSVPGGSQAVPCGKCAYCLQNRRSQWMFRIHHEMRTSEFPGFFLTLTYDERFVRRLLDGRLSLRFRDVQKFFKLLRRRNYHAKYICVGEYGAETQRPHYHVLLWTDCPQLELEKLWKFGRIHFGFLTMASAMYTLKYIIQPKVKIEDGREPTRAQFSRGLGLGYLTTEMYYYHNPDGHEPEMFSRIDGRRVSLPRYYKNKIFTKYQCRRWGHQAKWDNIREYRKYMRKLLKAGIKDTKLYIKGLRSEQAKRIISKTKFNQKL